MLMSHVAVTVNLKSESMTSNKFVYCKLVFPSVILAMALRLLAQRSLVRTAPCQRLFSTGAVVASSHGLNRLKEHYHNVVAEDLMVMTYDHSKTAPPTLKNADLEALLNNALSENVEEPSVSAVPKVEEIRKRKGGKPLKPISPLKNGSNVPTLDKITVHAMVKDAIHQKNHILSAFMALQSITASKPEVIFAKTSVANWKLR
jgi:large subunit ribosomal protein L5